MKPTAFVYSVETGLFTGRILRGDMDILARQLDSGELMWQCSSEEELDWRRNRVDTETGQLVPCQPVKPQDTDDTLYTWDEVTDDWVATPTTQKLDREARTKRKTLLAESDWTDTASAPARLGQTLYDQWQTYRQTLRDITGQPGYPQTIVWPMAPTE